MVFYYISIKDILLGGVKIYLTTLMFTKFIGYIIYNKRDIFGYKLKKTNLSPNLNCLSNVVVFHHN